MPLLDISKAKKGFRSSFWLTLLLLLILAAKVSATVFFANTTFDFTDGGCYMLWYSEPDNDPHPFYYFHRIVLGLFPAIDWNIVSLRLLKMSSELMVVGAMTFAVFQNLKEHSKNMATLVFAFAFIGLGYFSTWFPWIFYEYDLTYFLSVVSLSLVIGCIKVKRNWLFTSVLIISGVLTGIQFFNKFSASILLLMALLIIVQLCRPNWKNHLALFFGILIGFGAFFEIIKYTPQQWYQEYLDGYQYVIKPLGYKPLTLLWMYVLNLWPLPLIAISPILFHKLILVIANKFNVELIASKLFAPVLSVTIGVYFVTFPAKFLNIENQSVSMLYYYWYFPIVSYFLYYFFYHIEIKEISRVQRVVIIVWLVLPVMLFLGTATSAALALSSFLVPWYGLLLYLLINYSKAALQHSVLIVAFISGLVFYSNHIQRPYWTNKPIYYPRLAIETPNGNILLDSATARFVQHTKRVLAHANIEKGYPMVALHDMPGLVYIVGGYSPATPWYFKVFDSKQKELDCMMKDFNCLHISRIKQFEQRDPVFLINEVSYSEVEACLLYNGYDLKLKYRRPFKVSNPTIRAQLHRFSRGSSDKMLIFIPKQAFTQKLVIN